MDADALASIASTMAFAVSMAGSPGPNNAMVTASGATWGFQHTVPHMLGIAIGFPVMLLAVALGAGELLRTYPWVHEALRWIGAAYLLWLAWSIATARPPSLDAADPRRPLSFLQAALFQWVNPKAWVIALGAVVTYTTATGAALIVQASLIAALFLLVTLPVVAFWTMVGVGAARLLRTPTALRCFNLAMAALLVASLVPLLLER